ncbi:hypothetical protein CK203_025870 [Vitis vinifera]|uniref:Reverse transcriptase zinc-binding domain-containing protein n=1 Tax=Vitis vinifera TaxID=29760 RepID=A0A438IKQ0_VITVI|nr:hypothetical protein CK203_025870 [Vitis vinifera]
MIRVKYGQEGRGWKTNEARGWGGGLRLSSGLTIGAVMQRCPKIFPSFMPWCSVETQRSMKCETKPWDFKISSEEDTVLWKGGGLDIFRIRETYNLLVAPNPLVFPKKSIWVDKVPTKVAFFAWEATWEKILTLDRLQKRGWQLPNRCYLCGCEEENVNHILLHCTVVRVLWEIVLTLFGVQWVFPETVKEVGGRKGLGQETHPLFPDDTWLFCKACEESLDIFSRF